MIHTRIDEELHTKIFEKCNELGCTFSDFIINSLENSLKNEPEINNLDLESQNIESQSEMKNVKISYDGKTWIDL